MLFFIPGKGAISISGKGRVDFVFTRDKVKCWRSWGAAARAQLKMIDTELDSKLFVSGGIMRIEDVMTRVVALENEQADLHNRCNKLQSAYYGAISQLGFAPCQLTVDGTTRLITKEDALIRVEEAREAIVSAMKGDAAVSAWFQNKPVG